MPNKKKSKKGNPNFLSWLVDAEVGLFSPILKGLPEMLSRVIGANAKKKAEEATPEDMPSLGTFESKLRSAIEKGDLSAVLDTMQDYAKSVKDQYWEFCNHALAFDAAPFVNLGGGYRFYASAPHNAAEVNISTDMYSSYYNYAVKPMIQRYYFREYLPRVPEPYRLADFAAKGTEDYKAVLEAFMENGLSQKWANAWIESQYQYPGIDVLLELWRRGVISDGMFVRALRRSGMPQSYADAVKALKNVIPPLSDLIRMAVREAFPVAPGKPQFDEMKKWAAKRGLSSYWVERYWLAHFDRMGLTQAYENLWRGHFDEDDFKHYLMLADVHPDDWDAILRVAYRPPSIRELGYGYDVGAYTRDDIVKYRRWGGLSPEDAEKAATALIVYRSEAEREACRRELMYLHALGRIDEATFRDELKKLLTSPDKIELWVERAHLYKERLAASTSPQEPPTITRATAQWLFEHGVWSEQQLRDALTGLGYTAESIEAYVLQSKQRIKEREEPEEPKRLTLAQIEDLYEAGILEREEIAPLVVELGYSPGDAARITRLIVERVAEKLKPPPPRELSESDVVDAWEFGLYRLTDVEDWYRKAGYSDRDASLLARLVYLKYNVPLLRAMYRNGWINAEQLVQGLRELGIPAERVQDMAMTFIKYDEMYRVEKERDLTKSEIVKGVKAGILSPSQAVGLLMDMGYDENEAWYILAINKVVSVGDPEGYWEMRRVVELQKKARGLPAKEIPDELIELEKQWRMVKDEYEKARKTGESEVRIAELKQKLRSLEDRMRTVAAKLGLEVR